jgi:GLPGLI family protein
MIKYLQLIGFCALICLAKTTNAQETLVPPEGKIRYMVTSNWTKMYASLDYISKQRKERNAYMWGGSRSEWKYYMNLYFTPNTTQYEESDEKAEEEDSGYSWRKAVYTLRRNFETGLQRDHIETLGKTYLVEDSIQAQDWKIMNDLKEVAGHICMNAFWEDTLKKQRITVWFALDIPHSGGPERLCGLPGMILEADVNDGAVLITADKIELKKLTTEMEEPKKLKGKKVKQSDYDEMIRKHMAEKIKNEEPWFWGIRYF